MSFFLDGLHEDLNWVRDRKTVLQAEDLALDEQVLGRATCAAADGWAACH